MSVRFLDELNFLLPLLLFIFFPYLSSEKIYSFREAFSPGILRRKFYLSCRSLLKLLKEFYVDNNALDQLCINTIRTLAIDGVQKANCGHPGMPMGAAPIAYIYSGHGF